MKDVIKIAVISDIHAFNSKSEYSDKDVSHLDISAPDNEPSNHPITGLSKLIKDEKLSADVLIVAGDICDKACPVSLKYAWDKMQIIKNELSSDILISTAGNHDLDSRYKHSDYDAKGFISTLKPMIPIDDNGLSDKFWARNYVFYVHESIRFLILNTSAYHGGPTTEITHGRISKHTLQAIQTDLELCKSEFKVNILLCHHHLLKHDELDNDSSVMEGGDKLIDLLGDGLHGEWLVIHGHKHHPKIYYASGGGSSPVVFSSGSLCANLYPKLQTRARNQFHIIELPVAELDAIGLGISGSIYSWDWSSGVGWGKAVFTSGLPYISFFGLRESLSNVSNNIDAMITRSADPFMRWSEVISQKPQYKYITPTNLLSLIKILEKKDISITWNANGSIIEEIGKKS